MERTLIGKIDPEKETLIKGWVEKIRDSKYMIFLVIKDLSGKIQVTIEKEKMPEIVEQLNGVIANSVVDIYGVAHLSEFVKMGGIEFIPTKIVVESFAEALPITKDASVEQKLNYRWLDLREDNKVLIFQIATFVENAMREYNIKNNYIEIHTPKLTAQSTEGGSEVFKLDYFGSPAYLTQSPQFYKQMAMASGFEKVFEFGDCFRAEHSFTARHATEFTSYDVELSYVNSHNDVMIAEEEMLTYVLKRVKEVYGDAIKENFGVEVKVPTTAFPRISYDNALKILKQEFNYTGASNDFDTESERLICKYALEKYNSEFVFITEFPFEQRAFYSMRFDDNNKLSKSFDLLWKDVEITSGAQREHRPDHLAENLSDKGIKPENMQFYIDFFKYGCPAHGGYAIGIARLIAKLLNLPNIKESTFLFRGPNRIMP